jgi:tetratricopeptide (TPR) repeat protein
MTRIAWNRFYPLGFILLLVFSGCGEQEPPVEERVAQAEALLDAGQIENAIRILERANESAPERVDVLEALAFAYAAEGDPVLASLTFRRIAELVPQRPEYLLYAAESLLEAGDNKGAVAAYRAYLEQRPDDRPVQVALADLFTAQGRLSEALEALLAAEQLESRTPQRLAIGQLYLRRNNLAQAQAWFARALDGPPEFRDPALLGLLETAIRSRRHADAEALLAQLDAEYPGRLEQSGLDNVRDQLREWRQRQQAARQAAAALDERGRVQAAVPAEAVQAPAEERDAAAVAQLEQPPDAPEPAQSPADAAAVAGARPAPPPAPAAASTLLERARAESAAGDMEEAVRLYKRALVENDNQPAVWAELSEAYLESGNDRWAQATASEAMRRDPDNPKVVLQFLRAAQRTMDGDRLIREMEAAHRKFPREPKVVLVLARAYADEGNRRNARILYQKFLELVSPDDPTHAEVQSELIRVGG